MAEVFVTYNDPIATSGGTVFHARACGRQMDDGRWEGWIEFESIDGKPCEMVVLLASPVDRTGPHIQALAGVSRLWLNEEFRVAVDKAATVDALYAAFEQYQGT